MMGDPKNRQDRLEQAAALANGNQRLTRAFNLVALHLSPPAPAVGRELAVFAERGGAALEEIARHLAGEPDTGARPLEAARRALEEAPLPDLSAPAREIAGQRRVWIGAQFARAGTELTAMLLAASAWPVSPAPASGD
jgi:hypothetical protein